VFTRRLTHIRDVAATKKIQSQTPAHLHTLKRGVSNCDFTGAHIGFVPPGKRLHWTYDGLIPVRLRAFRKIAEETKNHDLERGLYIEERKAERGVYWHQLVEELKRAPEELKKQIEDINTQKKDAWTEWRLQVGARNAHRLGIAINGVLLAVHGLWIVLMFLYWALSNYGRNFVLPSIWLGLSVPFFLLALSRSPCAAHARGRFSQRGKI